MRIESRNILAVLNLLVMDLYKSHENWSNTHGFFLLFCFVFLTTIHGFYILRDHEPYMQEPLLETESVGLE